MEFKDYDIVDDDSLQISYGPYEYSYESVYYTGQTEPEPLHSSANTLQLSFTTDYQGVANGFKLTWTVLGEYQCIWVLLLMIIIS